MFFLIDINFKTWSWASWAYFSALILYIIYSFVQAQGWWEGVIQEEVAEVFKSWKRLELLNYKKIIGKKFKYIKIKHRKTVFLNVRATWY